MFNSLPKTKEFAITGNGGFSLMNENIPIQKPDKMIDEYDITNSVQLLYDVSKINKKFGLFKMNHIIIKSDFDESRNVFLTDNILISANEFIEDLELSSIISVGKLKTVFNDFHSFIHNIVSHRECFDFCEDKKYEWENAEFDNEKLYNLLKKENGFFGCIGIQNINEILNNTIFFENHKNIPKKHGFIQNDLLFIPYALNIVLSYDIPVDKLNHFGKTYILSLKNESDHDDGSLYMNTSITEDKIIRTVKIPLLLRFYDKMVQNVDIDTLLTIQNSLNKSNLENVNTIPVNTIPVNTIPVNTNESNTEPISNSHLNIKFRPVNIDFETQPIDFIFY